jgi:hypothetical protein
VDKSCQAELAKDNGHVYFIHVLSDPDVDAVYKCYSAFVLACLVDNYPAGKEFAKQNHLISTCHGLLTDKTSRDYHSPLLRQWCCICLGLSWQNYPEARWEGVRMLAHHNLIELVSDPVPEVRAAAIFALGTYIGCGQGNEADVEQTNKIDSEIVNALIKRYDIVFLVRKELIVALCNYVNQFLGPSMHGQHSLENGHVADSTSSGIGSYTPNMIKSQSTSALTSAVGNLNTSKGNSPLVNGSAASSFRPSLLANPGQSLSKIQENVIASQLTSPKSPSLTEQRVRQQPQQQQQQTTPTLSSSLKNQSPIANVSFFLILFLRLSQSV